MWFTDIFYKHIMFRHSCYNCHFCNTTRPSDLTLADFWGWDKVDPTINIDDKGCSLLFVNTEKGKEIFEAVKDKLQYISTDISNGMQPQLREPVKMHPLRNEFEQDYVSKGYSYVRNKYLGKSKVDTYKCIIKFRIRKLIPTKLILWVKRNKYK